LPFHNPYNFIPTPDRAGVLTDPFAGDHNPVFDRRNMPEDMSKKIPGEDHSRYWSERYTGTIPVVLKTRTPMFITDPATKRLFAGVEGQNNAHYCYDTLDYIPSAALKGMLSSAYEAITNSRYRVFKKTQHERKLGMRAQANPNLAPGRVRNNGDNLEVELFTGTTGLAANRPSPLYAAWLPMYNSPISGILAGLGGTFQTGVTIRLYRHQRGFQFWSVVKIAGHDVSPITHHAAPVADVSDRTVDGYVVISGKIFNRKHDERFFFNDSPGTMTAPVNGNVKDDYEALIADYQAVHDGGAYPPIEPGVVLGEHIENPARKTLSDGDFVYAEMNGHAIAALFPVQISREIYPKSPLDCVYSTILPAGSVDSLSPADRVFGWVKQDGGGAWKGKIRISDSTKAQTQCFGDEPIPLAILGNPKPAQVRFYLGNQEGSPQKNGIPKSQAAYNVNKKLRGRKVYLNQLQNDENYWTPGYWRDNSSDYCMKIDENETENDRRSGQNRSISSWIPAGSELRFNIKVENLTIEELGALLTLTTQKTERNLKMGYAKPLGFGSITLELGLNAGELLPIYTGEQQRDYYASFEDEFPRGQGLDGQLRREIINMYKKSLVGAYGEIPANLPQMPDIPDSWRNSERAAGIISEEQEINDFTDNIWRPSFERNADKLSFGGFSLAELLEERENGEASIAEELQDIYSQAIAGYREQTRIVRETQLNRYANAWGDIPFIVDFLKSTDRYEDVYYPCNGPDDKGYEWFAKNERQEHNAPLYGYSLPPVGELLNKTP
jgi:CRISPR-associated protein (TIGR03986 family)